MTSPPSRIVIPPSTWHKIVGFLLDLGLLAKREVRGLDPEPFAPDGSNRQFYRLLLKGKVLCLAILPEKADTQGLAEARSSYRIGCHLYEKGVAVPRQLAWDRESGLLLVEDLGQEKLYDRFQPSLTGDDNQRVTVYKEVLKELVVMQVNGADGFLRQWCWDSPVYDQKVMLERESGYFVRAFWSDLLGQQTVDGLDNEFVDIAQKASSAGTDYFLHRDFQSRNIMINEERVGIIDFQAGRFGPPGYDLASLLIDPYAALAPPLQEELFDSYIEQFRAHDGAGIDSFRTCFSYLALQRNLQIIGAFSFLSTVRNKPFFGQFLGPSLEMLISRLNDGCLSDYRCLRKTAIRGRKLLKT